MQITYIINMSGTDWYKIGTTKQKRLVNRINELQTGCPQPLILVGWLESKGWNTEKKLHNYFLGYENNLEWYKINHGIEWIRDFINYNNKVASRKRAHGTSRF